MNESDQSQMEPSVRKDSSVNQIQRTILIAGAVLALLALLFPPWALSGGSSVGHHFIFLPPRSTARVNSSLLFLQLFAIALIIAFLFVAGKNITRIGRNVIVITFSVVIVLSSLFGWFVWPKAYYLEPSGVRVTRLTGTRYVWSDKRGWITEEDKKAEDIAVAKPILDELKHVVVQENELGADWLSIYNPTRWNLSSGEVTVEFYRQTKGQPTLLKILTWGSQEIAPGLNNIYLRDAQKFLSKEPLIQKVKITNRSVQSVGSDKFLLVSLTPAFVFEYERKCWMQYTRVEVDPEDDLLTGLFDTYTSRVVCRSN